MATTREQLHLCGTVPDHPKVVHAGPSDRGPSVSEPLFTRPSAPARVVFDTFRSTNDPLLAAWLSFRSRAMPAEPAPVLDLRSREASEKRGVFGVWRLLATNNREIGRGSTLHDSPDSAWIDAESMRSRYEELTPVVLGGPRSMRHGWALRLDGHPVLLCSRWYESPGEANAAARAARGALGRSTIVRAVNIGTRSGRRHRQTTDLAHLVE